MLGVSYEGCLSKKEVRVVIALLKGRKKAGTLTKEQAKILWKLEQDYKEMW